MRAVFAAVVSVGIGLVATGCDPILERQYYKEGIGTSLYSSTLPEATGLLEVYAGFICRQSDLNYFVDPEGLRCNYPSMGVREWSIFVQGGMNDIDRRCDAYLAWLDDKRRSKAPILKQLNDTLALTNIILGATGGSDLAITAVAAAFGFATSTFTNVNSRLLLEVDHSTVQTVVFRRQNDYRAALLSQPIGSKTSAIYALRSYLRICMPMTIETDINTTVTLLEQGGVGALMTRRPIIDPGTIVSVPVTARDTTGRAPSRATITEYPEYQQILDPYDPKEHSPAYVERLQRALCVPSGDYRTVGESTTLLIKIFEDADPSSTRNGKLDRRERGLLLGLNRPACSTDGPQNYFERRTYIDRAALDELVARLNKVPQAGASLGTITSLQGARDKIKAVRAVLNGQLRLKLPGQYAGQMNKELDDKLPLP